MEFSYTPTTNTFRCTTEQLQVVLQGDAFQHRQVMGLVSFTITTDSDIFAKIIPIPKGENNYYRALYNALQELDKDGLDLILVEQLPETEELRAVNEKLRQSINSLVKARSDWDTVDTVLSAAIIYDLFVD